MNPALETVKAVLSIYRNLPWSQKMQYLDAKGSPVDLSAHSAKLVVRESLSITAPALHTFSTTLSTIVLGNGTIELLIPLVATVNAFTWNQGVGHLVLKAPGEDPKPLAFFSFIVRNSTTDSP